MTNAPPLSPCCTPARRDRGREVPHRGSAHDGRDRRQRRGARTAPLCIAALAFRPRPPSRTASRRPRRAGPQPHSHPHPYSSPHKTARRQVGVNSYQTISFIREFTDRPMTALEAAAGCAAKSVLDLDARLVVLVTSDVDYVRYVAKYRPRVRGPHGRAAWAASHCFALTRRCWPRPGPARPLCCGAAACCTHKPCPSPHTHKNHTFAHALGARARRHGHRARRARVRAHLCCRALPRRRAARRAPRPGGGANARARGGVGGAGGAV